jgi:dCTP deaminase
MILSDREIQAALARESVFIIPVPSANAWSSTAVDLTLDNELRNGSKSQMKTWRR